MSYQKFHDMDVIALQLRAGNTHTLQFILEQFSPALCYFAARLTDNETAATDIAEEAVLKLWDARKQFQSFTAIRNFLYASTRNGCFQYVKNWQQGIKDDDIWLHIWQETETYVEHEIIRAEVLRQVYNNIDQVPQLQSNNIYSVHDNNRY